MYELKDIKVTLLNPEEVKHFIYNHGVIACICYGTDERFAEKVGLNCLRSGHTSGSRGDFFKFEIECPRFTADQIMRHEQGVFKNCQSQRYVDMDNFDCYVSPKVANDPYLSFLYSEFEKEMYHTLKPDYLYYKDNDRNFVYFQMFTHSCMSLVRLYKTYRKLNVLHEKFRLLFLDDNVIKRITSGKEDSPAYIEIHDFIKYVLDITNS